jgi:hypothetical protein
MHQGRTCLSADPSGVSQSIPSLAERLQFLGRFGLRALRIAASTVSIVELLRSDWTGGIGAGLAWLVFLQVERRLPPTAPKPKD